MSIRSISRVRVLGAAAVVTLLAFGSVAGARLGAVPDARCEPVAPTAAARAMLARGGGFASGVGNAIVIRGASGIAFGASAARPGGLARHFAARPGSGTAYVSDRPGDDELVVASGSRLDVIGEPGEITHPGWSTDGKLVWSLGTELRLRSPGGGRIRSIAAPRGAAAVFSPVFVAPSRLVAVVSERVAGPHADAALDNLWRHDLTSGAWDRLTRFSAEAGRWSAIRTPVLAADGSVQFVRVRGTASATEDVSYQLWSMAGSRASRIRELSGEMYLAAVNDGDRIWNRFDVKAGEWRLLRESADGSLADIGCGRVQVDPRGQADPDLADTGVAPAPGPPAPEPATPSSTPTSPSGTAAPSPQPDPGELSSMAILVGDFGSAAAAEEIADRMRLAYGDAAGIVVVDNALEPMAVAPGVWAVVMPVPPGDDVTSALETFRAAFPEYAGWSWMVAI